MLIPEVNFSAKLYPSSNLGHSVGRWGKGRPMANSMPRQAFVGLWRSLRFRVVGAVVFLALVFGGSAVLVQQQVSLRRHDYAILNLSGQLRVTARAMVVQSENYLDATTDGAANPQQYIADLDLHTSTFDTIISSFKARELAPKLTGQAEPLRCTWNDISRNQLDRTATQWNAFLEGLKSAQRMMRSDSAIASAHFISENGASLKRSSDELTRSFQDMMEEKLEVLSRTIRFSLAIGGAALMIFIVWFIRGALSPLDRAISGFERVAHGDLGFQVVVPVTTELGQMTRAFNHLSFRLRALFGLSERINQKTNLREAVQVVFEEISPILPLDWVGVVLSTPNRGAFVLEGEFGGTSGLSLEAEEAMTAMTAAGVVDSGQPLTIENLEEFCRQNPGDGMNCTMVRKGFRSVVYLPLGGTGDLGAVLVFGSLDEAAYDSRHLELLANIAGQLGHSIEKTLVVDDLIVSAISGLAKLAESRDPETGDHLARMALYSAAVADQLRVDGSFQGRVTPALVREIFRFAPMHDIGKVGIEDSVLLKKGRLTDEERLQMQRHPVIGAEVLRQCEEQMNKRNRSVFHVGIEIAESHHERFDGQGYPHGIAGEEIPLSARVVAACDVFDALTSKRPYKRAWTVDEAFNEIQNDAAKHFDPVVVEALVAARPALMKIYDRYKHVD